MANSPKLNLQSQSKPQPIQQPIPPVQQRPPQNNQGLGLSLNKDAAEMLLEGLEKLPENRRTIQWSTLQRQLSEIKTIWDRRLKNQNIIKEEKAKLLSKK